MRRSFEGAEPKVAASAFLHPGSEIIGRATLGPEASLWPGAVVRADVGEIRIGARTNIQDCAVIHCREKFPTVIGAGALIGVGARIPPRSLVLGVPGKVVRRLTLKEIKGLKASEDSYVRLARRHRKTSRPL